LGAEPEDIVDHKCQTTYNNILKLCKCAKECEATDVRIRPESTAKGVFACCEFSFADMETLNTFNKNWPREFKAT